MEQTMSRTQTHTHTHTHRQHVTNATHASGTGRVVWCGVVCRAGAGARRERDVMRQENPQTV